ncbi:MAG: T9SS type A sorting domain-containing protein, partial [Bacteroidales bacterium]|nr:T9SS type A sorting domain-containing protein [Bacteroidales bacterium]
DYDGTNLIPVTNNAFFEGAICWSPDGDYLAYLANNAGNFDIWILPVSGGEPIQFTTHTASDMHPSWSSDGLLIAFSSNRSGNNEIWTKEVDLISNVKQTTQLKDFQIFPNPAQKEVTITYNLDSYSKVNLSISDSNGKVIKTLIDKKQYQGTHKIVWDTNDAGNNPVLSGIYICKLKIGNKKISNKIIIKR